jgi:hypothetical protein
MVRYQYGKLDARIPVGLRRFFTYLTDPLPAGPPSVTPPQAPPGVADPDASYPFGMLANDRLGCCTWAAQVHLRMANAVQNAEAETVWPTATAVGDGYLAFDGGQDNGCDEAAIMDLWTTTGMLGDKALAYGRLREHYLAELRSCIAIFGGVYLGADMPTPAQNQFNSGVPWALTDTADDQNIEGGHAFCAVGYDEHYLYVVTWGRVQAVTWQWWEVYGTEAWVVITSEDAAAKAGVNLPLLQADLAKIAARAA